MMQNGYFRKQEVRAYMVAGVLSAIANGKLERADRSKELFTAEDFLPKKAKEFTESEKEEMLRERQALAQKAFENSERFDRGVKIEDYG